MNIMIKKILLPSFYSVGLVGHEPISVKEGLLSLNEKRIHTFAKTKIIKNIIKISYKEYYLNYKSL